MKTKLGFLTEEGRTRSKNAFRRFCAYAVLMFLIAGAGGYAIHRYWVNANLTLLQRVYFKQYMKSSWRSSLFHMKSHYTTLVITVVDAKTKKERKVWVLDNDVVPELDELGRLQYDQRHHPKILLKGGIEHKGYFWSEDVVPDLDAYNGLLQNIYDDKSLIDMWQPAWLGAIIIFIAGTIGLTTLDAVAQRLYLKGEAIRGTRELTPKKYAREFRKETGYDLKVLSPERKLIDALKDWADFEPRWFRLRIPRSEENEGLLLLGDPGTGKSQVIHQLLDQIAQRERPEAIICYDPAGEFIERHFDPEHDIVLNPLDTRCPYWSPAFEVNYAHRTASATDCRLVAESFFPEREQTGTNSQFFVNSARSIFGRLLELQPSAQDIVRVLKNEKLIDEAVAGTEHAHLINEGAKGQRGGVLATLSEIGEALRLLPTREQCDGEFSLTEWARRRRGCIFITSTQDTRDALRRLNAAWINILMKRLLAIPPQLGQQHPCWLVVDEVHSLKRLPALETMTVEGRKYGVKMVLGTQNKAQFEEHYGRGAATMLATSHVKILFRCNEPDCARWVSQMIGEQEKERPRIGTTATVDANGRDSINYSTFTESRAVVSREEIMSLRNLFGYWKYSDAVVPFRIRGISRPQVALSFIPRDIRSITGQPPPLMLEEPSRQLRLLPPAEPQTEPPERTRTPPVAPANEDASPKAKAARKITLTMKDELDLEF